MHAGSPPPSAPPPAIPPACTPGPTTNSSQVCLVPSRHLGPAVCVVDRGQEVPELWLPSWDDGPVAVPEECLRAGWVHQHLRRRPGDRVRLCRRRQAPQPVLSSVASPHHWQHKDSASSKPTPASLTSLPHRLGKHLLVAGHLLLAPWTLACCLLGRSQPTPSDPAGICRRQW